MGKTMSLMRFTSMMPGSTGIFWIFDLKDKHHV
jgi:hypothetical protein